jgi:hypothetical protein
MNKWRDMTFALVSVEPSTGTLRRYETGCAKPRLTHSATCTEVCVFSAAIVEEFRSDPDDKFAERRQPRRKAA